MANCDACGKNSIFPEQFGELTLCKKCSLKVLSPSWKGKIFTTNDEVDVQREKTVKLARLAGFPEAALKKLNHYFNKQKIPGLIKIFDGGEDQRLLVFETFCLIDTSDNFDYDNIGKTYANILLGNRGLSTNDSEFSKRDIEIGLAEIASDIFSDFGLGKGLGKSVTKAGANLISDIFANTAKTKSELVKSGKAFSLDLCVQLGQTRIDFDECADARIIVPKGEEECGFILFSVESPMASNPETLFFFSASSTKTDIAKQLHAYIKERIISEKALKKQREKEEADKKRQYEQEVEQASFVILEAAKKADEKDTAVPSTSGMSAADELLKWKQVLDAGAITEEEYMLKKRQLLGL